MNCHDRPVSRNEMNTAAESEKNATAPEVPQLKTKLTPAKEPPGPCGPLGRTRHERCDCWSIGAVDYESDGASECSDGAAVYQGWEFVLGE